MMNRRSPMIVISPEWIFLSTQNPVTKTAGVYITATSKKHKLVDITLKEKVSKCFSSKHSVKPMVSVVVTADKSEMNTSKSLNMGIIGVLASFFLSFASASIIVG